MHIHVLMDNLPVLQRVDSGEAKMRTAASWENFGKQHAAQYKNTHAHVFQMSQKCGQNDFTLKYTI